MQQTAHRKYGELGGSPEWPQSFLPQDWVCSASSTLFLGCPTATVTSPKCIPAGSLTFKFMTASHQPYVSLSGFNLDLYSQRTAITLILPHISDWQDDLAQVCFSVKTVPSNYDPLLLPIFFPLDHFHIPSKISYSFPNSF